MEEDLEMSFLTPITLPLVLVEKNANQIEECVCFQKYSIISVFLYHQF